MRTVYSFVLVVLSLCSMAQGHFPLTGIIRDGGQLLAAGEKTILILPLDRGNESQKWMTFDASLRLTSEKKLRTPDAQYLVSQTYLEGENSIIRIDQFLLGEELLISAFVFDAEGNLIMGKDLELATAFHVPACAVVSPGKKCFSVVQMASLSGDSLSLSTLVFNQQLEALHKARLTIPFDSEQTDLYLPLLSNGGKTIIPTAEKFLSYRMSTSVECYVLEDENQSQKIRFDFKRRKLGGLQFAASGETIFLTGVYSRSTNRNNVSGVLQAGYSLPNEHFLDAKEFVFPESRLNELKDALASSGRKGNLLNHLAVLPGVTDENAPVFVTLLPAPSPVSIDFNHSPWQRIRFLNESAAELVATRSTEQLFFGCERIEAWEKKFAASGSESTVQVDAQYLSYDISPPMRRRINPNDNLIFLSSRLQDFKWLQLDACTESRYNFSQYLVVERGYGALYYRRAAAGPPQLVMNVIDKTGNVTENKIATDRDKFILADQPFLYRNGSLVCFYEDRRTGETGLWKLKVE